MSWRRKADNFGMRELFECKVWFCPLSAAQNKNKENPGGIKAPPKKHYFMLDIGYLGFCSVPFFVTHVQ